MRSSLTRIGIQSALITGACVVAYAGIRMIPVEPCEFLHYGDFITAEGIIEGCGYEETQFFDLDSLRFPIIATLTPLSEPEVGEEAIIAMTLFTTHGRPIRPEDIAVSHTEKVHALIVDPSLGDYQHIHPEPAGPPGHYIFTMTPKFSGEYSVYLDFILLSTNRRALVSSSFVVPGEPTSPGKATTRDQDLTYTLSVERGSIRKDEDAVLHLKVEGTNGKSIEFQPVMGSYAHLVAFQAGRRGFAHLHPRNPFIRDQDPLNPDLSFSIQLDRPGLYRIWAQIKVNGQERIIPFDLEVES